MWQRGWVQLQTLRISCDSVGRYSYKFCNVLHVTEWISTTTSTAYFIRQQGGYSYEHCVFHVTAGRVQLQTQRISCDSRASTATNTAYFMWQQGEYSYKHCVFNSTAGRVQLRKLRISCDSVGGMWIGALKGSWLWTDGTAAFAAGDYTNWKSGKAEWSVWSRWKMRIAGPCWMGYGDRPCHGEWEYDDRW